MSTTTAPTPSGTQCDTRRKLHLYKEDVTWAEGRIKLSARLESDGGESQHIWFELPEELSSMTTESLDAFVLASVFTAMQEPTDLHVHGQVSPSLLRNLAEFQAAWNCWLPKKYTPANITADQESEISIDRTGNLSIAAFSGGVDSSYTIWRHTKGNPVRQKNVLEAGLLVHGFDIPLEQEVEFARAAQVAKQTLESVGLKLLTMKSNLFHPDWEKTHGAAIAACLMVLQGRYSEGLVASTYDYAQIKLPWGTNPVTDRLLSSNTFSITHDGCGTSRGTKQKMMAEWKEGYNNLRICYSAPNRDKNCCRCGKCIMTIIGLRYLKLPLPASFERDASNDDILALQDLNESFAELFVFMARKLKAEGLSSEPWFSAFERCARFNQRRVELEKPLDGPWKERLRQIRLRWLMSNGP